MRATPSRDARALAFLGEGIIKVYIDLGGYWVQQFMSSFLTSLGYRASVKEWIFRFVVRVDNNNRHTATHVPLGSKRVKGFYDIHFSCFECGITRRLTLRN